MPICVTCCSRLLPDRVMCNVCGAYNWNPAPDPPPEFKGQTIKASELIDATDVEASHIEHVKTGPWDGVFGGGPVPGSTALICGLAGGGKSTLILQISTILAQLSGKPAFYISGEQSAAELKFTLDRLQIQLERGQLRLAKSMGSSGLIDDGVLAAAPPSSVIVDSLTELCGQKQYDAQVALAKAYKEPVAIKYRCPVFLISQMGKSGDTFGMAALQHGPDTLIEVLVIDDGRRRARILREYGLIDGDVRLCIAFKNRFGPTHQDFPLLMTAHGFTAIPKAMKRVRKRTGDPLKDVVLEIQWLEEDIENERGTIREMREELVDLREKMWKLAGEKSKPQKAVKQRSPAKIIQKGSRI